jgi:hypothetical protein
MEYLLRCSLLSVSFLKVGDFRLASRQSALLGE